MVGFMKKYLNLYTALGAACCALFQFISWGMSSRVFEYILNGTKAESGESQVDFIISFGFARYMLDGFSIMQIVLPLISVLLSCSFIRLCIGYYENAKSRIKLYCFSLIRDITVISLFASLATLLGFLLFYFFGMLTHPIVISENYSRSFLSDVFGGGFSWQNPLGYYLVEGIFKFGIFPFFYCFFACTSYLFFSKTYMGFIIPIGYYVVFSMIAGTLSSPLYGTVLGEIVKALRPSNMLMMGAESGSIPVWYPLISLIPPVIASIIFFVKGIRNEEKYG